MYIPRHRSRPHLDSEAPLQLLVAAALVLSFVLAAGLLFFSR